jgi:ankyrin repeat protein
VALLLQQTGLGLGVKAKDREGCTPLHVAAFGGHTETLELLLKHASHEDWKAADRTGRTLLHHASAGGHVDTVKMLLEMDGGVDLLRKTNYNMHTPLHIAAKNSKEKVVELLLERGADKMVKDKAGNTPRDLAVKQGYMRVVEALDRRLGDGLESECKVEQYSGPRQLCYH